MNEVSLKNRLKDYIIKLNASSSVLDCSGLVFLEIVLKESALIEMVQAKARVTEAEEPEEEDEAADEEPVHPVAPNVQRGAQQFPHSAAKGRAASKEAASKESKQEISLDTKKQSSTTQADGKKSSKPTLYGFADVMGPEMEKLPSKEIAQNQKKKAVEAKLFSEPNPSNIGTIKDTKPIVQSQDEFEYTLSKSRDRIPTNQETSFNDIFDKHVAKKKEDQKYIDLVKDCERLNKKISEVNDEASVLPNFSETVNKYKNRMIKEIKERKDLVNFMQTMTYKMQQANAGFKSSETGESTGLVDEELSEEIDNLATFYNKYSLELEKMFMKEGEYIRERHTVDEYIFTDKSRFDKKKKMTPEKLDKEVDVRNDEEEEEVAEEEGDDEEDLERRREEEKRNAKKMLHMHGQTYAPSTQDALKRKRKHNEHAERKHRHASRDSIDSQKEFEDHEKNIKDEEEHIDYKKSKAAADSLEDSEESAENENNEYKKRLLQQHYKGKTSKKSSEGHPGVQKINLDDNLLEEHHFPPEDQDEAEEEYLKPRIGQDHDQEDQDQYQDHAGKAHRPAHSQQPEGEVSEDEDHKKQTYEQAIERMRTKESELQSDLKDEARRRKKIKMRESSRDASRSKSLNRKDMKAMPVRNVKTASRLPPMIPGLDASKYENMIYKSKKRKTYIVVEDYRNNNKNYISLRQGDIVCSVLDYNNDWMFVYFEDQPARYGFFPSVLLNLISS